MTIRCTERRFGLVGLFTAETVEGFLGSIDDTIDRLAWSIAGASNSYAEVRRLLLDGVLASLEVVGE